MQSPQRLSQVSPKQTTNMDVADSPREMLVALLDSKAAKNKRETVVYLA